MASESRPGLAVAAKSTGSGDHFSISPPRLPTGECSDSSSDVVTTVTPDTKTASEGGAVMGK